MVHEFHRTNAVIFQAGHHLIHHLISPSLGDIGTTFYVILKGSASVQVRIPTSDGSGAFTLREVKILKTGDAFGELALLGNKPRAATILCKEDSHFAVLDKQYYKEILSTSSHLHHHKPH